MSKLSIFKCFFYFWKLSLWVQAFLVQRLSNVSPFLVKVYFAKLFFNGCCKCIRNRIFSSVFLHSTWNGSILLGMKYPDIHKIQPYIFHLDIKYHKRWLSQRNNKLLRYNAIWMALIRVVKNGSFPGFASTVHLLHYCKWYILKFNKVFRRCEWHTRTMYNDFHALRIAMQCNANVHSDLWS